MEARGYSDVFRNTTEELFIKTLMEGSIGMPAPTMEMLGFKNQNLSQSIRADSEELFKSWLTTGENQGYNSTTAYRTRQASKRISTELSNLSNQHNGVLQKRSDEIPGAPNASIAEQSSNDYNQHSIRNEAEKGVHANLYLAKAWFHSSQPMTRSRSSELRKRYAAIQNQTAFGIEAMNNDGQGVNNLKQEFGNPNEYTDAPMCEIPNQFATFMSPSNSSSSNFNTPKITTGDKVSSVVSMLKGTLERKRLNNHVEKEAVEDSSFSYFGAQEVMGNPNLYQGQESHIFKAQETFQDMSILHVNDHSVLETVESLLDVSLKVFAAPKNPIQMSTISREPSQSESSAAAPVASAGFDGCDGPSISGQTQNNYESSLPVGKGNSTENGSGVKDIRERIYDHKKGSLVRHGSVTSAGSVDRGDPTKKRRVERSRKMAEAKERVLTPTIPSDMKSILKRCENLEKEARSLKLNLAFMNRKDSEQTKQIEELQKQNEELGEEKERLLEEIERIISETGKM